MEIFARLKSQSPVYYRDWSKDNGEQVKIKCINVELERGGESIICEANERVADRLEQKPLTPGDIVVAYVKFVVTTSREGRQFQNCRLVELLKL